MRRRGTWWMLPRSRAGEKVGPATFRRKTCCFGHTFPLSPGSGPGGSREILGGSRGPLEVLPGLSGDGPRGPSGILLPGFLLQVSSSGIPPQGILPQGSCCRIPLPGSHVQDSSRIPHPGFLFQGSSSRIPLPGALFQDSSSRIAPLGFLFYYSSLRTPPPGFLFQDFSSRIPLPGFLFQDSSSRIPLSGFLLQDASSRIPPLRFLL